MKLLVDSNIILDLFINNRPDIPYSVEIMDLCQLQLIQGFFATFSMPTIIYLLRDRYPTPADHRVVVDSIMNTLTPVDTATSDLTYAFTHDIRDYEDGFQAAAAARIHADYILTHNIRDFRHSPIPAITPRDFVEQVIVAHGPDHPHHPPRSHS